MTDMISRAAATSLPPYDGDGDPAGQFDHHIFVKLSDLRALPAAQVAVKQLAFDAARKIAELTEWLQESPDNVYLLPVDDVQSFLDLTAKQAITPPAVSDDVAALVEAATALADWAEQGRACGDWGNWDWADDDEYSRTRAAIAKMKGGT